MLCGSLDGRRVQGRVDTSRRVAEFLRCSPETILTLLTGYTPIQNKKFKTINKTEMYPNYVLNLLVNDLIYFSAKSGVCPSPIVNKSWLLYAREGFIISNQKWPLQITNPIIRLSEIPNQPFSWFTAHDATTASCCYLGKNAATCFSYWV